VFGFSPGHVIEQPGSRWNGTKIGAIGGRDGRQVQESLLNGEDVGVREVPASQGQDLRAGANGEGGPVGGRCLPAAERKQLITIVVSAPDDVGRMSGISRIADCTRGLDTKDPARLRRSINPISARRDNTLLTVMREQLY